MSRFYFDDADPDSQLPSDDESSLPFPVPLSRVSFSGPSEFSPAEFLTSLSSRHQTLEDLREELRNLSSSLNNELLDLVNENYTDFLGLGRQLRGGDERIEEVRVGLLGFQREIEVLKKAIEERRKEMAVAIDEKRVLGREVALGRRLLEVDERLGDLENSLMIGSKEKTNGIQNGEQDDDENLSDFDDLESEEGDSSDEADGDAATNGKEDINTPAIRRLRRNIKEYQILQKLMQLCGASHPFIEAQKGRMEKIQSILVLDVQSLQKEESIMAEGKVQQELTRLETVLKSTDSTEIPLR